MLVASFGELRGAQIGYQYSTYKRKPPHHDQNGATKQRAKSRKKGPSLSSANSGSNSWKICASKNTRKRNQSTPSSVPLEPLSIFPLLLARIAHFASFCSNCLANGLLAALTCNGVNVSIYAQQQRPRRQPMSAYVRTTMRFPGMKDCILEATVESSFRLLTSLCTITQGHSRSHRSQSWSHHGQTALLTSGVRGGVRLCLSCKCK